MRALDAKAAVAILHRHALAAAPEDGRETLRTRLADEYERTAGGVCQAMAIGVVDEVTATYRL